MAITNELRNSMTYEITTAPGGVSTASIDIVEFANLCDNIDSVHAALEAECERLREQDHDGWIELPKDADGVPIHVGDYVEHVDDTLAPRAVTSINLTGDGCWVYINGVGRRPDRYRHHQPDTWERIEDDATMPPGDYVDKRMSVAHGTIETVEEAFEAMACDLVARCKALAGERS